MVDVAAKVWQAVRQLTLSISIINQHWCLAVRFMSLLIVFVYVPLGFILEHKDNTVPFSAIDKWQSTRQDIRRSNTICKQRQTERKKLTASKGPVRKCRNRWLIHLLIPTVFKIAWVLFPLLKTMTKAFFKFFHREPDWYLRL